MDFDALREIIEHDFVDVNAMSKKDVNSLFESFNEKMMIVYLFVLKYNDYINNRQAYAPDEALTMLEVHLLTDICDAPGSTVTSLSNTWSRSLSATSQTIRRLIQKGLVTRKNSTDDAKVFFLEPTKKGKRVSDLHKRYDVVDTIKTLKSLRHQLTMDEIDTMFKGLNAFTSLLRKK